MRSIKQRHSDVLASVIHPSLCKICINHDFCVDAIQIWNEGHESEWVRVVEIGSASRSSRSPEMRIIISYLYFMRLNRQGCSSTLRHSNRVCTYKRDARLVQAPATCTRDGYILSSCLLLSALQSQIDDQPILTTHILQCNVACICQGLGSRLASNTRTSVVNHDLIGMSSPAWRGKSIWNDNSMVLITP